MKYLFILLTLTSLASAQSYEPAYSDSSAYVAHTAFTLLYAEEHEQARWVSYTLTKESLVKNSKRKNNFKKDPLVSTESAKATDYKHSGYDRGHMCPAAAMAGSQTTMDESFYMSNMSPQDPKLNRGQWKELEKIVRNWTKREDTLHVVTGPIFNDNLGSIGTSGVTIPGYYFKAIYDPTGEKKMIALIVPNSKLDKLISFYCVSIDDLEKITGLDFFHTLDDDIEDELESSKGSFIFGVIKYDGPPPWYKEK